MTTLLGTHLTRNIYRKWDDFRIFLCINFPLLLCLHKREPQCIFLQLKHYLFECELKLSCVKQELEQDPGVVLGITENLVFYLAQSLVVWIIGCRKITN